MKFTVLLKDGTTGTINGGDLGDLGEVITVQTSDENGNPIEVQGELVEVLGESEY